jgi:plastocyanin
VISVTAARPFQFTPRTLTVTSGTTVRWAPGGTNPHTITSDGCVNAAAGACVFDSGLDPAGRAAGTRVPAEQFVQANTARASFEFKFNEPGIYAYFCRLHGAPGGVGESGTVNVLGPGQLTPPGRVPLTAEQLRPPVSLVVYSPREGQVIQGNSVPVQLGINGATVRPEVIGQVDKSFGHYNLLLDTNLDLGAFLQAADGAMR